MTEEKFWQELELQQARIRQEQSRQMMLIMQGLSDALREDAKKNSRLNRLTAILGIGTVIGALLLLTMMIKLVTG